MQIQDKVFVVTGGGNGIAREVVLQLLAKGAEVAALDLSETGLAETAQLANAGDRLSTHIVDVTDRAAVEALPDAVKATHGRVDGLLNIAGIIHRFAPIAELTIEEIEKVIRINYWGTVYAVKSFLPDLLARPEALILDFSSMGGLVPVPGQGAYGSSKAAVKLFTETLFAELQGTNVHVTVVFPGGVSTNITGNSGVEAPGGRKAPSDGSQPKPPKGITLTTPQDAGRQVVEAIERNTPRLLIGKDAKGLDKLGRISPVRAILTVQRQMKAILG
ncbi:MAG: SDR family NAD(P)-dependent oxidoreductase [Microbacteriaceae bacterium]|nr:SDR family NAD(P)-dependent oxidoreductase [Microbacteriaceae bacterium]